MSGHEEDFYDAALKAVQELAANTTGTILVEDLISAIVSSQRQAMANAWAEGYLSGNFDGGTDTWGPNNPFVSMEVPRGRILHRTDQANPLAEGDWQISSEDHTGEDS